MNTKNNKRRQASREQIESVFIELLQTKELSQITVSEIIQQTGLNRSTFYANYQDIYHLADTIRKQLEKEVSGLYQNDITTITSANDYLQLFYHIRDNQLFYKTYFKLGYDQQNPLEIYKIPTNDKRFSKPYIIYHIEFFRAGFNAIVKKWLQDGCKESPETMSQILQKEYQGRELL